MRTRVLVVCHANRYRSPLAAAFLGRYSHLDVRSAGFKPGGVRVGKPVRDIAKTLGFDLEAHRSVQVNPVLIEWADVIAVMNPTQLEKLMELFPKVVAGQNRVLLGSCLPERVYSIPDLGFINPRDKLFDDVVGMIRDATAGFAAECLKKQNTSSPK